MKFAIDLTWMRHKIVGGAESYIFNILLGLEKVEENFDVLLVTAKDNSYLYNYFENDNRFTIAVANVKSVNVIRRIIWQNINLPRFLKKKGYNVCFAPIPFISMFKNKIKYITVIHDLQMKHFPQFHSKITIRWYEKNWKNTIKKSKRIITISDYCKNDICKYYNVNENYLTTIYNAIDFEKLEYNEEEIFSKFGISKKKYFFTISKLNKHKNLSILLDVFAEFKRQKCEKVPLILVVSGVNGSMKDEMNNRIKELNLEDNIILTGYISNEEKTCLYHNAYAFLFPSIFEGFGMPLIEAMREGTMTITTSETCIPEVTQYKANYVKDPYSVVDWMNTIINADNKSLEVKFDIYYPNNVAKKYLKVINEVCALKE